MLLGDLASEVRLQVIHDLHSLQPYRVEQVRLVLIARPNHSVDGEAMDGCFSEGTDLSLARYEGSSTGWEVSCIQRATFCEWDAMAMELFFIRYARSSDGVLMSIGFPNSSCGSNIPAKAIV